MELKEDKKLDLANEGSSYKLDENDLENVGGGFKMWSGPSYDLTKEEKDMLIKAGYDVSGSSVYNKGYPRKPVSPEVVEGMCNAFKIAKEMAVKELENKNNNINRNKR